MARDSSIFMNSVLLGKITKNKTEEIRISVLRNNMVDVRTYFYFPNEAEPRPTKKGIWLSFKYIPEILEGFEKLSKDPQGDINLEFDKSENEKVKVYSNDFMNNRLVHIRTFYLKDNEFQPGRGISFSVSLVSQMIDLLSKASAVKEK